MHDLIAELVVRTGITPDVLADMDRALFNALLYAALPGRYPRGDDGGA